MTPIPTVLVHLLLEWNAYLLFNPDIVNFVWRANEEGGDGGRGQKPKAVFC